MVSSDQARQASTGQAVSVNADYNINPIQAWEGIWGAMDLVVVSEVEQEQAIRAMLVMEVTAATLVDIVADQQFL